jgi:ABC-2 type transport system ATP-binding protein
MIEVSHLTKRYGSTLAVSDLSFEVGKGDVVGFLGPNGAGKSTTLRILAGFLGMTSGSVKVAGYDIEEDAFEARKHIGYMPEAVPLYPEMRVAEYLAFRAELKRVPRAQRRARVDEAMEKAGVMDRANVLIGNLSKGYRQRVGLADALVARPPLLILDEPTAGLDPNQILEVRALLKELGNEHTVLLSTHILSEVEASCSHVVVIDKGKLVAQGATADLQRLRRTRAYLVTVRGDVDAAEQIVKKVPGVAKVARQKHDDASITTLRCHVSKKLADVDVPALPERIVEALVGGVAERGRAFHVREVKPIASSLEEVFAELTRGQERAKADDDEEAEA